MCEFLGPHRQCVCLFSSGNLRVFGSVSPKEFPFFRLEIPMSRGENQDGKSRDGTYRSQEVNQVFIIPFRDKTVVVGVLVTTYLAL